MTSPSSPTTPASIHNLKYEIAQITKFESMIQQCEEFLGLLSDLQAPSPSFRFPIHEPFDSPSVRTQAHYLAAIKMVLDLRRRLRYGERTARYWKARAQEAAQEELVTPSSSYSSTTDDNSEAPTPNGDRSGNRRTGFSLNFKDTKLSAINVQGEDRNSSPSTPGSFGDCIGIEDEDYILRRMNFRDTSNSGLSDQEHVESPFVAEYLASVISSDTSHPSSSEDESSSRPVSNIEDLRAATACFEELCTSLVTRTFRSLSDIAEGIEPSSDEDYPLQTDLSDVSITGSTSTSGHSATQTTQESDASEPYQENSWRVKAKSVQQSVELSGEDQPRASNPPPTRGPQTGSSQIPTRRRLYSKNQCVAIASPSASNGSPVVETKVKTSPSTRTASVSTPPTRPELHKKVHIAASTRSSPPPTKSSPLKSLPTTTALPRAKQEPRSIKKPGAAIRRISWDKTLRTRMMAKTAEEHRGTSGSPRGGETPSPLGKRSTNVPPKRTIARPRQPQASKRSNRKEN